MKVFTLVCGPPIAALLALGQPKQPPPPPVPTVHVPAREHIKQNQHRKPIKRAVGNKVEKMAPGKAQPKPKKEQGTATGRPAGQPKLADAGPDLPYSCGMIRMFAAGKSRAELEALGRANGITAKQKAQAQACFK